MKNVYFGFAMLISCSMAFAESLVVATVAESAGEKGQVSSMSLDISSSASFKGFQFDVDMTGATSVDLSSCTASLPKNMMVACKQSGNRVRVIAADFDAVGTEVKAGRVSVGVIKYQGKASPAISNIEFVDKNGEVVPSSSTVAK